VREDSSSASATDALGSVRLTLDDNGTAYSGATYDPWGSPERGSVGTFGFTGELQQGDNVYLRARWYNAANGTFTSKDPFEGYSQQPYSLHPYQYAYSNPVLWTDPSGEYPEPPLQERLSSLGLPCSTSTKDKWTCDAVMRIYKLRHHFLDSARRHYVPEMSMSQDVFAGLLVMLVVNERRIGNDPHLNWEKSAMQSAENILVLLGCVVSGHALKEAADEWDWSQLKSYALNEEIPQYATVGIGNVGINTARNIWQGVACPNPLLAGPNREYCTPVDYNPLKFTNFFGGEEGIVDPYRPRPVCTPGATSCRYFKASDIEAYQSMGVQLLNDSQNIEYLAANLAGGAKRAVKLGVGSGPMGRASPLQLAAWHANGALSNNDLRGIYGAQVNTLTYWNNLKSAYVDEIPRAIKILQTK
jgi:RHS repeat-associated protein